MVQNRSRRWTPERLRASIGLRERTCKATLLPTRVLPKSSTPVEEKLLESFTKRSRVRERFPALGLRVHRHQPPTEETICAIDRRAWPSLLLNVEMGWSHFIQSLRWRKFQRALHSHVLASFKPILSSFLVSFSHVLLIGDFRVSKNSDSLIPYRFSFFSLVCPSSPSTFFQRSPSIQWYLSFPGKHVAIMFLRIRSTRPSCALLSRHHLGEFKLHNETASSIADVF